MRRSGRAWYGSRVMRLSSPMPSTRAPPPPIMSARAASALLLFSGSCDCGSVDAHVGGNISVTAHATNPGSGQVRSRGGLGVLGSGSLSAHDITIDVAALNTGHGTGDALATALLAPDPGVALNLHAINLQANASSQGVGGARGGCSGRARRRQYQYRGRGRRQCQGGDGHPRARRCRCECRLQLLRPSPAMSRSATSM